MLQLQFPQARVYACQTLAGLDIDIANCGVETTIFVRSGLLTGRENLQPLLKEAADRGAKVVVIGAPLALDFSASVIAFPFSSDMIMAPLIEDGDADAG